jgi:hypothetical protein
MTFVLMLIIACGVLAIVYGVQTTRAVLASDPGSPRMQEIAAAIQEGAAAYLARQYTTIATVGVVIFFVLAFLLGLPQAVGFAIGALLSGAAGYIGMNVSVRANVRTAQAATKSLGDGLSLAFRAGAITGLLVAGLALLGVSVYFLILTEVMGYDPASRQVVDALVSLGFGASLISIFARLGGGIFTKGADVGGDLVGKVEAGIPEDDPRNPATIADNVGDNVGDCAGMAADLFETYVVTVVATMVLASIYFAGGDRVMPMMLYPLAIGALCVITSIIGTYFVRLGKSQSIMGALYKGVLATGVLSLILLWPLTSLLVGMDTVMTVGNLTFTGKSLFLCGAVGLLITALIVVITEYYTGTNFRPVQSIAKASVTGHGTNVIQGLAVSMEATALPALVIMAGILVAYGLRLVRDRHLRHHHARARRHDRSARRFRPRHRQCRWHRRDVGHAERDPQDHRRARCGRQHHQGGDQRLRHRLGGPGRTRAVCGLYRGPQILRRQPRQVPVFPGRRSCVHPVKPVRGGRPLPRRPAALSVRRYRHDRRRARRKLDRRGGAPPVQGEARHHEGHRAPGLQARRRSSHPRCHQGDDRPVPAPGADPRRVLLRGQRHCRQERCLLRSRRHAARRDRHRPVRRHLNDRRRRRLGQRQEIHRGRPLWR